MFLKGKYKTMFYKEISVKLCIQCNSSKYKFSAMKFRGKNLSCTICNKGVRTNNCILCYQCDHFIHQQCSNLSNKDIKQIENLDYAWSCNICNSDTYPFSSLNSKQLAMVFNPPSLNVGRKPKVKSKTNKCCFLCKNSVVNNKHYKNKYIYYNKVRVLLCITCSKNIEEKVEDRALIEYLDCTVCNKLVNFESVFCNICLHWVDAHCCNLNEYDLNQISDPDYGDWICLPCNVNIFPFWGYDTRLNNSSNMSQNIYYKKLYETFPDCSICNKIVRTKSSLCCSLCRHWVDRKCISTFNRDSESIDSYESMTRYYKNRDWFCFTCSKNIFPFLSLSDEDFSIECYEFRTKLKNENIKSICKSLMHIDAFDDIDATDKTYTIDLDTVNPDNGIPLTSNCQYIFDLNELPNKTAEISVINFNIRSIRKNFSKFSEMLHSSNIKFDVITLTESWLDKK